MNTFIMYEHMERQGRSQTAEIEHRHEISINVVCATSKASDHSVRSVILIKAFASHFNML